MNNWWAHFANLEETTKAISSKSVLYGGLLLILLTILSIVFQKNEKLKRPFFFSITAIITAVSITLVASTVYLNVKSESKGPVHWHADIEYWVCDTEVGLRDPYKFLSNKIGTSTYHEHNDKRIHLEGVVIEKAVDASLGKFMEVVGGEITNNSMTIPVNSETDYIELDKTDGDVSLNGDLSSFIVNEPDYSLIKLNNSMECPDAGDSEVQVFVYQTVDDNEDLYFQQKVANPASYTISEHDQIPPGDCVIFQFGPPVEKTDKICKQLGVRDIEKCERFGVTPEARGICQMTEIDIEEVTNDA